MAPIQPRETVALARKSQSWDCYCLQSWGRCAVELPQPRLQLCNEHEASQNKDAWSKLAYYTLIIPSVGCLWKTESSWNDTSTKSSRFFRHVTFMVYFYDLRFVYFTTYQFFLINTDVAKQPWSQILLKGTGELWHPRNFLLPLRHFYLFRKYPRCNVWCGSFRIGSISRSNVALMVFGLSDFHSGSVISEL